MDHRGGAPVRADGGVDTRPLLADGPLPLLFAPRSPAVDLAAWAAGHRARIEEDLLRHGGLLFRGFGVDGPARFEAVIRALCGSALEYKERSSPRSAVEGKIYTSTDYPPSFPIFLHNESSYQNVWPLKIFFLCQQVAEQGGETPIADCRRVFAQIDPPVRDRFLERGWMYVRNVGGGCGHVWMVDLQIGDDGE